MTIHSAMILNVDPKELKLAIHLVGMLLIQPWMSMISVVSKKICQFWGMKSGWVMEAAARTMAAIA